VKTLEKCVPFALELSDRSRINDQDHREWLGYPRKHRLRPFSHSLSLKRTNTKDGYAGVGGRSDVWSVQI